MTEPNRLDLDSPRRLRPRRILPRARSPRAGGAAGTATATLTLEPPQAVTAVPTTQAAEAVKLDPEQTRKLD